MVKRAFIAVILLGMAGAAGYYVYRELGAEPICDVCYRPLHPATYYKITLENGDTKRTCCPRCGLRFQKGRNDVAAVETADFNSGKRLDAKDAYYVENSDVHLCCSEQRVEEDRTGMQYELAWDRCLPSLVAFEKKGSAQAFSADHGGRIRTYAELLEENE